MTDIAIIGGTGLTELESLEITRREVVYTPYGEASGPLTHGVLCGREAIFLARHGYGYTIPPHMVNFQANIWGLHSVGVRKIVAVNAVGAISRDLEPGMLAVPDQIIDYTYGRKHTFFEADLATVTHVDFTRPYSESLRDKLINAASAAGIRFAGSGTYGSVQGPRFETVAEIDRLERDGCDMVGMTGMPEATLARELELEYASCAVIANYAAGRADESIHKQVEQNLAQALGQLKQLLEHLLPML